MRGRDAGFTLIELMASLAILAMISVLISSGLVTGHRVWSRLDRATAAGEAVGSAQSVMRGLIERAYPITRFDASAPYVDFEGSGGTVTFFGQPSEAGRPGALRRYQLGLDAGGEVVLSSATSLTRDRNAPYTDRQVLVRGARSLDLAYFGAGPPDNTLRWRDLWRDRPAPPQLVRVRVQFPPGDARRWPDLIVRPLADVDTQCILDTASGRCRGRS